MTRGVQAPPKVDLQRLERSLRWALKNGMPARDVIALLRALVAHTSPDAPRGRVARLELAERLLIAPQPAGSVPLGSAWEAAGLLHRLLRQAAGGEATPSRVRGNRNQPEEPAPPSPAAGNRTKARDHLRPGSQYLARVYGAFGLACTILGHYRAAKRAYGRALHEDPGDPAVAHNLGHLLATKLQSPLASLIWLQRAHAGLPGNSEVAASLAHALVRTGQCERAVAILSRALGSSREAHRLVANWLLENEADQHLAVACE